MFDRVDCLVAGAEDEKVGAVASIESALLALAGRGVSMNSTAPPAASTAAC